MSSDANKAVIRRYVDELNRRNLSVLDEVVAPGFREAVRLGYERNLSAFPDYEVTIHDMIAEGDQVVVEWSHKGVHEGPYEGVQATGKTIVGNAVSIYRVVDGQIADARGIWDRGEVWQQLGLIPSTETVLQGVSRPPEIGTSDAANQGTEAQATSTHESDGA